MNPAEANALVARLVAFYPGSRFNTENAAAYEHAFSSMDARETAAAIETLIGELPHLPAIAAIRAEVVRAKREAFRQQPALPPIEDVKTREGPSSAQWGATLRDILEKNARYDAMARRYYAEKGRPYPGNPAQKFAELAAAGARGEDVIKNAAQLLGVPAK